MILFTSLYLVGCLVCVVVISKKSYEWTPDGRLWLRTLSICTFGVMWPIILGLWIFDIKDERQRRKEQMKESLKQAIKILTRLPTGEFSENMASIKAGLSESDWSEITSMTLSQIVTELGSLTLEECIRLDTEVRNGR